MFLECRNSSLREADTMWIADIKSQQHKIREGYCIHSATLSKTIPITVKPRLFEVSGPARFSSNYW